LHELLEWAAQQGFREMTADPARLRDFVARRCNLRGWAHWIEPLNDWIRCILTTPLHLPEERGVSATAVSLASLDAVMGEMEFWFAATAVEATEIDRLITMQTLGGASRPPIQSTRLNGMLKGFIDLVFEHEGRYYVADYKSNWLGPHDAAYTPAALCSEILRARYDLQYVLYLLALHRLLRSRLPDYDYDRHVGGALYLFLRGLNAPSQGLHVERPCRELIDALDVCFAPAAAGG
jgi:exodeoxyribonuclease V beta subunit